MTFGFFYSSQGRGKNGLLKERVLLFCIRTFRWGRGGRFVFLFPAFDPFPSNPPTPQPHPQQIVLLALVLLGVIFFSLFFPPYFCMATMINANLGYGNERLRVSSAEWAFGKALFSVKIDEGIGSF